jgi:NifU-like protein involved in Fe-S cluster formation
MEHRKTIPISYIGPVPPIPAAADGHEGLAGPYRDRIKLLDSWEMAAPTGRMLDDIYNSRILELAGNIPRIGRLEHPDATARAHSRLCGSTVTVDLKMDGDVVTDFAHEVKACALGQASSSIMARHIVGAHADELRAVRQQMLKMLKENGPPPTGRFEELKFLEPVRDYKARHASTMLTFDAVVDALDQIEARRKQVA